VKLNDKGGYRKMFKPLRNQNGRTELRDAGGRLLGYYYQKQNQTRDKNGRLVGFGNLLTKLLDDCRF
jgi:hypothetical protein